MTITDNEIIEIRDSFLPNQGEPFNEQAYGRALYEAGAAAERAVSDKLLEALKEALAGMGGSYAIWSKTAIAVIAKAEAMRKENGQT